MNVKMQQITLADQFVYKQIVKFSNGEQYKYKFYHDMLIIQYKLLNHSMSDWPTIDNKPVDLYNLYQEFQKLGGFFEVYKKGAPASQYNMKKQVYCPMYIKYLLLQEQIYINNGVVSAALIQFVKKFVTRKVNDNLKQCDTVYYPDLYIPPLASKINDPRQEVESILNQQIDPLANVPKTSKPLLSYQLTQENDELPASYEIIAANAINEYIYKNTKHDIEFYLQLYKFVEQYSNETLLRSMLVESVINQALQLYTDPNLGNDFNKGQIMSACVLILSKINELNIQLFSVGPNTVQYRQYNVQFNLLALVSQMGYSVNSIYAIILFLASIIQGIHFTNNYCIIKELSRGNEEFNIWLYNAILKCSDQKIQYAALTLLRCQIIILNDEQEGINGHALEICQSLIMQEDANEEIKSYLQQILAELWEGDIYPTCQLT